jgi:uncharacterized protein (DUF1330 family)
MAAYVIVELEITDAEGYSDYRRLVPPTLAAYDGKFLVRGGASESLEGSWHPQRLVVLEFPSVARAKEWWDSPEYSEAKALRQRTAATRMVVVEGIA